MNLIFCTWKQVEQYLKRSSTIIVPVGSTEQHGPTGYIGTDAICAEVIAGRLGEETNTMVGPTITVGMSVHHTEFPGSITMKPITLTLILKDYFRSVVRHGFRRIFIVNGHGGNSGAIHAATWEFYDEIRDMNIPDMKKIYIDSMNWWDSEGADKIQNKYFGDKNGGHATPGEISVALAAYPAHAHSTKGLKPCKPSRRTGYGPFDFRRSFPDGRLWSQPELASAKIGEEIIEASVRDIAKRLKKFADMD